MTGPDRGDVHRCAVRGCPFLGYWPAGGLCPSHRAEHARQWPEPLQDAMQPDGGDNRA